MVVGQLSVASKNSLFQGCAKYFEVFFRPCLLFTLRCPFLRAQVDDKLIARGERGKGKRRRRGTSSLPMRGRERRRRGGGGKVEFASILPQLESNLLSLSLFAEAKALTGKEKRRERGKRRMEV